MADEGLDTAKIAVRVLIVLALVAAIFGIYQLVSSRLNAGTNKLSENLSSMDSSTYAQYDNQIVTGTEVLTALKTFRDADFAVVVCNNAGSWSGSALQSAGGPTAGSTGSTGGTSLTDITLTQDPTSTSATGDINYCGLIAEGKLKYDTASGQVRSSSGSLAWNADTGTATKNLNFSATQQTSNTKAYVQQKAKWYSKLIYDDNDTVIGVIFAQFHG